jgi:hypothetical protein
LAIDDCRARRPDLREIDEAAVRCIRAEELVRG